MTFHKNQRGNIIVDDQFNIALAFEQLGIVPTFERAVLKIGQARRYSFPDNRSVFPSRKRYLEQTYRRELDKLRVRIQRECGFLPKRGFLEAVAEILAKEAEFG